jgi:uncharacterized membrane protein YvbJ
MKKKNEKERPRFYCDNCGSEVAQDEQECHNCGRSFLSVRCPACGLTGEVKIFDNGCPKCGYSVGTQADTKPTLEKEKPKKSRPEENKGYYILPIWVYVVTGIIFFSVFAFLFYSLV